MAVSLACLAVRQGIRGHDDGVGVWHKPRRERGYIRRNAITGRVELVVAAKPLKVIACSSLRAGQTVGRRRGKFAAVFHDDPNAAFIAQLAAAKVKSNGSSARQDLSCHGSKPRGRGGNRPAGFGPQRRGGHRSGSNSAREPYGATAI